MDEHDHVIELHRLVARTGRWSNGKVLAVGHGSTVEVRGGTPATVSPYRLNQARSKFPGVTGKLTKGKGRDDKGRAALTTVASNSGEVPNAAVAAEASNVASPSLKRSRKGVEVVEGDAAGSLARGIEPRLNDDGARAWGNGTVVMAPRCSALARRGREGSRGASEGQGPISWRP
jgi:hypothetical protein